jgi:hypothetical protein
MDVGRANPIVAMGGSTKPDHWQMLEKTPVYRDIGDYRLYELAPSSSIVLNGHQLTTNRWGMRDRDYDLEQRPGTYRIGILGSSSVMGLNVGDDETFESLVESRLNRELGGKPYQRYEILNFGVNGYNPPTQVTVLDKKVLPFKPDAVVIVFNSVESFFTVERFAKSLRRGIAPIDDIFREIAHEAKVDARTPALRAERRLAPYAPRLIEWSFRKIAERCRQEGIRAIWVFQPMLSAGKSQHEEATEMTRMARDAGFSVINLEGAYAGVNPESLTVAPWDAHPNAEGHRRLAEGLYAALVAGPAKIFDASTKDAPREKLPITMEGR